MAERAIILCKNDSLGIADFPVKLKMKIFPNSTEGVRMDIRMNELELIRGALKECCFNQKATADKLGITRDALIRRMKKYNINVQKIES